MAAVHGSSTLALALAVSCMVGRGLGEDTCDDLTVANVTNAMGVLSQRAYSIEHLPHYTTRAIMQTDLCNHISGDETPNASGDPTSGGDELGLKCLTVARIDAAVGNCSDTPSCKPHLISLIGTAGTTCRLLDSYGCLPGWCTGGVLASYWAGTFPSPMDHVLKAAPWLAIVAAAAVALAVVTSRHIAGCGRRRGGAGASAASLSQY